MPDDPRDDATRWAALESKPRRRWRRRLVVGAAALTGVVVVLGALSYVGYRSGANANPVEIVSGWLGEADTPSDELRSQFSGRQLYETNCALCHGPAGEGGQLSIKGPAFAPGGPLSDLTFEERVARISRGRPLRGMPRWKGKISAEDIRRIAAYTQLLSGQTPDPSVEGVR